MEWFEEQAINIVAIMAKVRRRHFNSVEWKSEPSQQVPGQHKQHKAYYKIYHGKGRRRMPSVSRRSS